VGLGDKSEVGATVGVIVSVGDVVALGARDGGNATVGVEVTGGRLATRQEHAHTSHKKHPKTPTTQDSGDSGWASISFLAHDFVSPDFAT